MSDQNKRVLGTEVIIKNILEDGTIETIQFNLSEVNITQSIDMIATYNEEEDIKDWTETPGREGLVNITINGVLKNKYDN